MAKIKYLSLGCLFLIILVFMLWGPRLTGLSQQELLDYTPQSPLLAALVLLGLYCLKAFVMFIPLTVLYLAAGMFFPWWWAIIVTYICLTVESSIGYFLGRRLGRRRVQELVTQSKYGKKLLAFSSSHSIFSCFIIRLIPGPPIELTNMLVGTTGIKYPHFIIGTLLGYTPGLVLLIFMGKAATGLFSPSFLRTLILIMGMILTFSVVGGYLWRKMRRRRLLG